MWVGYVDPRMFFKIGTIVKEKNYFETEKGISGTVRISSKEKTLCVVSRLCHRDSLMKERKFFSWINQDKYKS